MEVSDLMSGDIFRNLERVRAEIQKAEARSGRPPGSVQLVAISKTHSVEKIREAMDSGQLVFGESKVQEAKAKIPDLPAKLHWHFIGHLQRNKVRAALSLFELIHGVDSVEGLVEIARVGAELGQFPRVLLQVNLAAESSKFGFSIAQLKQDVERIVQMDRVQVEGLMTIPPAGPAELSRKYFAQLRELRDDLQEHARFPLPQLSMGMSGDYAVAIEEGSTMVRVGTAIFGVRGR